ncbi:MAG: VanW family protein [Eubacteriales bacterium]|nr:VanW family protein [Eubacteriales bacterium]
MKKFIAVILAVIIVCCTFTACSERTAESVNEEVDETTVSATTTTMRTTEDLSTTFKEAETNTIYPALKKDTSDDYPYEISSFTTYYLATNTTRTTNIHNAVDHLNNVVIPAGETFSFNQTVGKRTVLAGYEEAKVVKGDEFVDGLGGGICQVSSTVFQAALRANLEIKVRACHSLEISYVDLGGDATVQWNSQDFQFVNNSDSDIKMSVIANDGTLTCKIFAKEDIKPKGKVEIKIKKDGKSYVLTRSVDGKVNYTTYSKYQKAKTTTTKKDKDKDKTEKDKTEKKNTTKKN